VILHCLLNRVFRRMPYVPVLVAAGF
jgi:hypothetical protein